MKANLLAVLLIVMVCNLGSCKKEDASITKLDGLWIEQKDRADTIDFRNGPFLELRRGTEYRDGHVLPKYGSGQYQYNIKGNSISLISTFSSCAKCYKNYSFKFQNGQILIGDFYNKNSGSQETLIFIKQK
jgi:hypothetical protein